MSEQTGYEFLTDVINRGDYENCAKQAHESWLRSKLEQGWTYGPQRDDERKLNPFLVGFEDLPNEAKAANTATPYAVTNFFRTKIGKNSSLEELKTLFQSLLSFKNKEILAELSEYVHSHFIITLIAKGENTQTRKDMVVFEDLDNDVKSWDTYIALEVIEYLQKKLDGVIES